MKLFKPYITLLYTLFISFSLQAQISHGLVKEGIEIESDILDKNIHYTIYLPFDYETSNRFYPVVYLLHGFTDNDIGWIQFGEANMLADKAIAIQNIPPMILVMPDGGLSFYINNHDNSVRYEDFFFEELIPHIESTYRIRSEKRYRGISGLSMGGYGSILYSIKHPNMFAACAAFSAAIRTPEEITNLDDDWWKRTHEILYGKNLSGKERLTPNLLSNNIIHLVKNGEIEKLKSVQWYIDCGDDDFLYKGNSTLHILMRDLEIPHEFRVRDGGHQWSYWRNVLIEGLKFIGASFH